MSQKVHQFLEKKTLISSIFNHLEKKLIKIIRAEIKRLLQTNKPLPHLLLSDKETANLLGISVKTLPVWRHKGKGPNYIRVESSIRYKLSDIHSYLKEQTIKHQ